MSLAPRVVLVHRRSEYDELVGRHGSHGQAAFFLSSRGRDITEVVSRHEAQAEAVRVVSAAIPVSWRRGEVEREDLSRFLFAPEDVVVVVGQDGLVPNVAKYLAGQPVIGIDPEPGRNPGVLVRHPAADAGSLLLAVVAGELPQAALTMVVAEADDGQHLVALNEIFVGHASHQTARYTVTVPGGASERQASSGLVIGTATGATGWCSSIWRERHSTLALPSPVEPALAWFTREAWVSPVTGDTLTEGRLGAEPLLVTVESNRLVAFGDGIEDDHLTLGWGQQLRIGLADRALHLVV
ncbi:inorganic polyphosphate kinase [Nocardioides halotolerans]|uniref:inorganic polyphosphate kinase n=1 Tax=Nocardioides halotolerans TaxID=433660 RepID=UPI0004103834|nr:inorganic polyphosphate kinase [Nocardioides halotolerans]